MREGRVEVVGSCVHVTVDPRLLEAVLTFTGEVARVADTLVNLGLREEADRLLAGLDRLDAAPEE